MAAARDALCFAVTPFPYADIMRSSLTALAADPESITVRRLWKALTPEERTLGISGALADDPEGWVKNSTRTAIAGALRFRPQSVASWPRQKLIGEAARLPVDDVRLLSAYVVDLHLSHRRPMMADFLNALAIPNDEGRIDSEKTEVPPQDAGKIAEAADALVATHGEDDVVIYFLTLLLQDAPTWAGVAGWLKERENVRGRE